MGVCLEGTNLVNIEVNSSMIKTVRKVSYGLVELLRVVKAHNIKEPSLIRFALPKLDTKGFVGEVQLSYNSSYVHFHASYKVQPPGMFANAMTNAIKKPRSLRSL